MKPVSTEISFDSESYKAIVPDTLDLAERAEFAINALTGMIMPEHDYERIWMVNYVPPSIIHHSCQWHENPRTDEALAGRMWMDTSATQWWKISSSMQTCSRRCAKRKACQLKMANSQSSDSSEA